MQEIKGIFLFFLMNIIPFLRMHHDGSGVLKAEGVIRIHTTVHQSFPKPSIKLGHAKTILISVHPVQLPEIQHTVYIKVRYVSNNKTNLPIAP